MNHCHRTSHKHGKFSLLGNGKRSFSNKLQPCYTKIEKTIEIIDLKNEGKGFPHALCRRLKFIKKQDIF